MSPHPRSVSRLFDWAYHKLFPRRTSNQPDPEPVITDEFDISDITDGFYLYSLQETQRVASRNQRSTLSTDGSYVTARMDQLLDQLHFPTTLYTVGSIDWELAKTSRAMELDADGLSEIQFNSIIDVYTKVYAIAKLMSVTLLSYGVEMDHSPHGLLANIEHAESIVTTLSANALIECTEKLYYALYARVVIEMANVELCSSFQTDIRSLAKREPYILPHPVQAYKILLIFKEALDSQKVCSGFDKRIMRQYQEDFVTRTAPKCIEAAQVTDDFLGYRRHIMGVLTDSSSLFRVKWAGLSEMYKMPPGNVLMVLSEKYLPFRPKLDIQYDILPRDLPFIDVTAVDSDKWEQRRIRCNRDATLAKLESRGVGEVRQEKYADCLMDYLKEKKCVCASTCECTYYCTYDCERFCPCSEYVMRIMLAEKRKYPGKHSFAIRCINLANALFEKLATMRTDIPDSELNKEGERAIQLLEREVRIQRDAMAMTY
ncbi:hypothetical protein PHISCL_05472 [Aspergillus sclerotialis]|uniref:Uncharacterized protein n=1 Tax=Aspergillus sclerotialis TaxID=2070753 RepID=A0A3A2ZGR3_9EURO|nr:hypothetical protein PHISCL_05472 [Aspergillus sclerotialis]